MSMAHLPAHPPFCYDPWVWHRLGPVAWSGSPTYCLYKTY